MFDKQDVSSIGAVAIDPKNHDVVWVGTGETNPRNDVSWGDGVYKSTDGGKTWTNVGLARRRTPSLRSSSTRAIRTSCSSARSATCSPTRRDARRLPHGRRRQDVDEDAVRRAAQRRERAGRRSEEPGRALRGDLAVPAQAVDVHVGRQRRRHLEIGRRRQDVDPLARPRSARRHDGTHRPRDRAVQPAARLRADRIQGRHPVALRRRGRDVEADDEGHARRPAAVLLLARARRPGERGPRLRRLRGARRNRRTAARRSRRSLDKCTSTTTTCGSRRTIRSA